jgi:crotonobetainyl-CoA:carnitine CoA-transferase CaiB-like acyl-CoA transferase
MTDHATDAAAPVMSGVRIVELAIWVAGPSAGGILADWGADVVKVESPAGDPQRSIFAALGYRDDLPNPPFDLDNRGKRSVTLDLRSEAGREAMERLLGTADVFITNLRPAALARLGLDHEAVMERHPSVVYAAMTGYGLDGPEAWRPGYDIGAFWARSGIARMMVPPDEPPIPVRMGLGDHMTGVTAVAGIAGALFERSRTGRGRVVEISLLRTGLYAMGWPLGLQLAFGRLESATRREDTPAPLVNCYAAGDGRWFWLIALEGDRHFPGIIAALERPELADDARFADAKARKRHATELVATLDAAFATRPMAEWAERFDAHDVWWAPAHTPAEVLEDPQVAAAGGFIDIATAEGTDVRSINSPVTFRGASPTRTGRVPGVGEHTVEVLVSLGYSEEEASALAVG